jgi:hypothetical protein
MRFSVDSEPAARSAEEYCPYQAAEPNATVIH